MFGKYPFTIGVILFLVGCAQPRYERVEGKPSGNFSQDQKVTNCELKFNQSGYCLYWQWEQLPTSSQSGTLVFKVVRPNLLDGTAVPVDLELTPALVLWMPEMGHGSSPTHVEKIDTGSYRAREVFFVMPGEWEMKFQFKDGDTVKDESVVTLTI